MTELFLIILKAGIQIYNIYLTRKLVKKKLEIQSKYENQLDNFLKLSIIQSDINIIKKDIAKSSKKESIY